MRFVRLDSRRDPRTRIGFRAAVLVGAPDEVPELEELGRAAMLGAYDGGADTVSIERARVVDRFYVWVTATWAPGPTGLGLQ